MDRGLTQLVKRHTFTDMGNTVGDTVEVQPGTYYVLAWKDLNNNGIRDLSDLEGYYGCDTSPLPVWVPEGGVVRVDISMEDTPPVNITGIWVVIRAASGTGVDVNNARIQIYSDAEFTNLVAEGTAVGSSVEAQDTVEVQPGTYYVLAWKDVNNDGYLGPGDFFGYYSNDLGQPQAVQLQQNQVVRIEFTVTVYPY